MQYLRGLIFEIVDVRYACCAVRVRPPVRVHLNPIEYLENVLPFGLDTIAAIELVPDFRIRAGYLAFEYA